MVMIDKTRIEKLSTEMAYVIDTIIEKKKEGRPLKSIILSRYKYDRLENWLEKMGHINEDTYLLPIYFRKVEIKRATDTDIDTKFEYHLGLLDKMSNIGKNCDLLKIDSIGKLGATPLLKY